MGDVIVRIDVDMKWKANEIWAYFGWQEGDGEISYFSENGAVLCSYFYLAGKRISERRDPFFSHSDETNNLFDSFTKLLKIKQKITEQKFK